MEGRSEGSLVTVPEWLDQEDARTESENMGRNRYPLPGMVATNRGLRQSLWSFARRLLGMTVLQDEGYAVPTASLGLRLLSSRWNERRRAVRLPPQVPTSYGGQSICRH